MLPTHLCLRNVYILIFPCVLMILFRQLAVHLEPLVKNIPSVYEAELLHNILVQFENNPSWTASHVAAELEIVECFENVDFMKEAKSSLKEDGITPLHVACKVHFSALKLLVNLEHNARCIKIH